MGAGHERSRFQPFEVSPRDEHGEALHSTAEAVSGAPDPVISGVVPAQSGRGDVLWEWRGSHAIDDEMNYGLFADRLSVVIDEHDYDVVRSSGRGFWDISRIAEDLETALSGGPHGAVRIRAAHDGQSIRLLNLGEARIGRVLAHRDDVGDVKIIPTYPGEHRIMLGEAPSLDSPGRVESSRGGVFFPEPGSGVVSTMAFNLPQPSDSIYLKAMQFKIGGHDVQVTFSGHQDVARLLTNARFEISTNEDKAIMIKTTADASLDSGKVTFSRHPVSLNVRDGEPGGLALDAVPSFVTLSDRWPAGLWGGNSHEPVELDIVIRKGDILRETVNVLVHREDGASAEALADALNRVFVQDPNGLVALSGDGETVTLGSPEGFVFEQVTAVVPSMVSPVSASDAQITPGQPGVIPLQDTSYRHLNEPVLQGELRLDRQYSDMAYTSVPHAGVNADVPALSTPVGSAPEESVSAFAVPSTARFDLTGSDMILSGSGSRAAGFGGDLSIITLHFQVGDDVIAVRDVFSTLKEVQKAVNDAIRDNPSMENTLAKINHGALIIENTAAQPFTVAHWSATPAMVLSLDLLDRVDGRIAVESVPSTAFLDIGPYAGYALSLPFEFVHPVLSSPGVLDIGAQEGRTAAQLADLITRAGVEHGIRAAFVVENEVGQIVLQDLHGRDFRADRMSVGVEIPDGTVSGYSGVCLPASDSERPHISGVGITSPVQARDRDWIDTDSMMCRTEHLPTVGYSLSRSEFVQDVFELLPESLQSAVAFFVPEFAELV